MCGILYANSFNNLPVNDKIKEMYEAQKQRGREGFGIFDGQEMNIVHATKEERIMKWLNKYSSNLIMFHHRFPTSTINVKQAAHPFTTKKYFGDNQYILIHNGHINNSYSLKSDHEKLGINYHSIVNEVTPSGYNYKKFNDSESLLWDFALTMEGKQEELKAYGGMAFICVKLHKNKLEKLYFGRNTNPIKMQIDDEGVILSSTGDGEDAKEQTLYEFDYKTKKLTDKPFKIPSYTIYTAKNHSYERYNSGYVDGKGSLMESSTFDAATNAQKQLTDLYNQSKPTPVAQVGKTDPTAALKAEALKYKSAEEFVTKIENEKRALLADIEKTTHREIGDKLVKSGLTTERSAEVQAKILGKDHYVIRDKNAEPTGKIYTVGQNAPSLERWAVAKKDLVRNDISKKEAQSIIDKYPTLKSLGIAEAQEPGGITPVTIRSSYIDDLTTKYPSNTTEAGIRDDVISKLKETYGDREIPKDLIESNVSYHMRKKDSKVYLPDLYNQAHTAPQVGKTPLDNLKQEASKYKTPEEFFDKTWNRGLPTEDTTKFLDSTSEAKAWSKLLDDKKASEPIARKALADMEALRNKYVGKKNLKLTDAEKKSIDKQYNEYAETLQKHLDNYGGFDTNSGYEDYDYDREGNIQEIADMYDNRYGGRQITSTATPVVKERYKPTLGEIYVTKIMYLSRVDGNYSKAYEEMEKDCLNLDWLHYDNSIADKHIAILEEAMESILSETTFIDDDSISPQYIKRHHRALKHHGTESIVVNELKEEGDE